MAKMRLVRGSGMIWTGVSSPRAAASGRRLAGMRRPEGQPAAASARWTPAVVWADCWAVSSSVSTVGDLGDVGVLHLDEAGGLDGAGLVDFLLEIDELADERGVFGDDDGGGVGNGGDGAVGTELADDLGEDVHRLGRLDVVEASSRRK